MNAGKTSSKVEATTQSERIRKSADAERIIGLPLSVNVRIALKATLLSPTMLLLMGLGAVSTFLCIGYVSGLISSFNMSYTLSEWYAMYGVTGVTPAYAIIEWLHWSVMVLIPLVLFVSIPLGYGVSSIIAEDVGAMPESLLMSRPVSRWRYLLANFLIRSVLVILVTFVVPFMLAYPSAVSAMESSYGSFIATKMTLHQWTQSAWGPPLVEVLVLYSAIFLVISAITLAVSTVWRRGAVAMPVVLVVVGVGPIVSMILYFLANYGGVAGQGLPWVFHLLLPFRLFTGELDASYSFPNLLIASTAWWVLLAAISLALYNRVGR